jgi:hypothetical protein
MEKQKLEINQKAPNFNAEVFKNGEIKMEIKDPCKLCEETLEDQNIEAITYCDLCNEKKKEEKEFSKKLGININKIGGK